MYDGMTLYRAVVVSSSSTTGDINVVIPAALGDTVTLPVSRIGRSAVTTGVWNVPKPQDQVLVAIEDERFSNIFLVPVSESGQLKGLSVSGNLTVSGSVTASTLIGNGASLTNVNHSTLVNLTNDDHTQYYNQTRGDARYLQLSGGTLTGSLSGTGASFSGTITAATFSGAHSGSGASLTSIPNSATTATNANTASAIVARDASGNFSAGAVTATSFSGDGSALTSLNASNLSSGTVPSARISGSYTGITGLGTISGALTATGNIVSTAGAYYSGQSGVSNGGLASYTSYDRSLPYTSSTALYMQSAIARLYHSDFGDVLQAASTGAVTIPGALTGNGNITGSRLKTSSNQLDIGSWSANSGYAAISKPDGATNNYLLLADTSTTFISTPSSAGGVYIRPGLNNTTGQLVVTTSGITCATATLNTVQSDASNNLTLQAGGSSVIVSPSGSLSAITSTSGYQALYWGTTFGNWARFTSRRELKERIETLTDSGATIDALRPVTFVPRATTDETDEQRILREADVQHGFIAEEVAESAPLFATYAPDEMDLIRPVAWRQHDMTALLVAEVQSLRNRVTVLENTFGEYLWS